MEILVLTVQCFFLLLQQYDLPPVEDVSSPLPDTDLLTLPVPESHSNQHSSHALSPSLDLNDNEDLPTELSDSSETHDEGVCIISPCHIQRYIWIFN